MLTTDQIKDLLAAELDVADRAALAPKWNVLAPRADADAKNAIYAAFVPGGYSSGQIDRWDRFEEFQWHVAMYLLGFSGRAKNAVENTGGDLEHKQWWADLKGGTLRLTVGGIFQSPASVAVKRWGVMSNRGAMFPVPRRLFGLNGLPADTPGVTSGDTAAAAGYGLSDGGDFLGDAGQTLGG
jgi:hypothetical protein